MARQSHRAHLPGMKRPEPEHVPVAIPIVVLTVAEDGTMSATLNGAPITTPEFAPPWRRESFPQIIDQASNDRTRPVRVEVREADGSVFTDLIPARPRRAAPDPAPTDNPPGAAPRALPLFHPVEGDGFVPGEDVAVAIVTAHTDAAHTGIARALIDPDHPIPEYSAGGIEVLLFGRISGAVSVRRLT